ncbi:type II toxin-antitoxin system YafQ family toxin [Bifidobacterium canis]|uniref:RelE/StbE family addiction module toxin n=1 Tax=Bifidobacterium canis TaxID=2610880 RepID=A0A7K1J3W8_9BIFI|nr:type II toxin-antitoxin system YafQ family toxin [Bifidobacterium canis]MUH59353.1 RelE/StbE family addiction module toxin [Bifidobacterium canis]
MLKTIFRTTQFKKDFKVLLRKHYGQAKFQAAVEVLMKQDKQLLVTKYREIHIEGDWLLIYRVEKDELQLVLTRTGSHDDLF